MCEQELPTFLNDLLDQIIRDNDFHDYSVKVEEDLQAGDRFMSEIKAITVTEKNSEKQLHLVCKMAPRNKNRRKEFMSDVLFSREALFYKKLMPILAKFQQEKNLSVADQFVAYPKCYGAVADGEKEHFALFFEDLRYKGFQMYNKSKVARIENARLAMREIGKFHGISYALKDQRPEVFAEFEKVTDIVKKFFSLTKMKDFFISTYDRAIDALKNEHHKNVFRAIKKNLLTLVEDGLGEQHKNKFAVLTHGISLKKKEFIRIKICLMHFFFQFLGDFWNNNFLFKFKENVSVII